MLAALLLNLGAGPVPPKPPAAAPFFARGGGPFLRKYGYDWDVYGREEDEATVAQQARAVLPGEKAEEAEAAIATAVQAVREERFEVVLDAAKIYERVFLELRGDLKREVAEIIRVDRLKRKRIAQLWDAEIKRRVKEQEEDELIVFLLST